jgi:hypothetical protein
MGTRNVVSPGRFVRVASATEEEFDIFVEGAPVSASPGQSLLAAILAAQGVLRRSDVAGENRAGFCLMGACQECWIWLEDGRRLRACTTNAAPSMRVWTGPPPGWPAPPATGAS